MPVRDTWLVFVNEMGHRRRQALWLVAGLMQPLLYLFLYGPMVTDLMAQGTGANTWYVFAPALLLQAALTQSTFVGLNLLTEYRMGIVERFRVAPLHRTALVLGKLAAIAVSSAVLSTVIMTLCQVAYSAAASVTGAVLSVLLNVLLAVTIASCSYAFALRTKKEDVLNPVLNTLLLPLLLLSGAFLPITEDNAPAWLYHLSRLNPITHVMNAGRALLRDDYDDPAVLFGVGLLLVLAAGGLVWAVRVFAHDDV